MIREFPYRIDVKLKHKLDLLAKQLTKKDVWILVTGDEGSGKTNTAAYLLYYFHCVTGREFTIKNFYFDSEDLFNYAKATKEKMLNWDEAALGGLSSEWWTQSQINLIKLAITGRKLHHIFVLCIPRFDKLKEDLRMDRIHAQIHMDCGKLNDKYGKYIYLTRRGIKYLNRLWKEKRLRLYGKAMKKCGGFGGDIPYIFDRVFTKEEQDYYENKKDEAIANIGKKKGNRYKDKLKELQYKISNLNLPNEELAQKLGVTIRTIQLWNKKEEKDTETATPSNLRSEMAKKYINNGGEGIDND